MLFLTLDFSKQNGVSVNFRTSLRRDNVIYTRAKFSQTKALAKWSVTAATYSSVTACMQIRAQFRLFRVKAMFKQHVNLMIWTWILRLQTASRNEIPCKKNVNAWKTCVIPIMVIDFYSQMRRHVIIYKYNILERVLVENIIPRNVINQPRRSRGW